MNNLRLRFYFKILIFTLVYFFACGFQTSFWPNILPFLPGPQIWLVMMIFITLKWEPIFSIFYIYFLGYCLTFFSDVPLKMVWTCSLIVFCVIWFIKNRAQLSGTLLFVLMVLVGSTVFELSYYNLSDLLEPTPTTLQFFDRVLQILINFLFSYPLYFALEKLDKLLLDENNWTRSSAADSNQELTNE